MITVELPWMPSVLRPNRARTRHWAANGTAAKLYKSVCAIAIREQGVPRDFSDSVPVALTIRFHPPTRRRYDRDGSLSALKAGLDALADHLGMDDNDFEPITICRGGVVKGGKVVITITDYGSF